ncbi:MAG: patatin-like phospholipase family protein [Nitrospinota bacterium]
MKKILSLDGGGIRGIIPATILAYIEERTGKNIARIFDLIAGTSSGGVLAMALCKSDSKKKPVYSARSLIDLYEKRGGEIFSRTLWKEFSSVAGIIDQRYSHEPIEKVFKHYFGKTRLSDSLTKVLVSTYDIENRKPCIFKSWKSDTGGILMKDAARATSAAPTYFAPAVVKLGKERLALIDGGVYLNNPSMSAYSEAKKLFPRAKSTLLVSIGSGALCRPIPYDDAKDWGLINWARPILSIISDGVNGAVAYQLKQNLGKNFIRLQTPLENASDEIDDTSEKNIEGLKQGAQRLLADRKADLNRICDLLVKRA